MTFLCSRILNHNLTLMTFTVTCFHSSTCGSTAGLYCPCLANKSAAVMSAWTKNLIGMTGKYVGGESTLLVDMWRYKCIFLQICRVVTQKGGRWVTVRVLLCVCGHLFGEGLSFLTGKQTETCLEVCLRQKWSFH